MEEIIEKPENSIIEQVAHDLKSIIIQIGLLNQILINKLQNSPDGETHQVLYYINTLCHQGSQINNNLLNICELESCENNYPTTINCINQIIKEQSEVYKLQADKKQISFHSVIPNEQFYCELNTLQFIRVLNNLFSNALKFTMPFGQIIISLAGTKEKVIISVSDTGIGIPNELQKELFKKYTKARRYGTQNEMFTGLGLYIAKEIVELQKGKIWFESKENVGTTFYIELENKRKSAVN